MAKTDASIETKVLSAIEADGKERIDTAAIATKEGSIQSREVESEAPLKPWEKPGKKGDIRRTWRSIQRYIWDDPDKSDREKRFLFKLDVFLLSYSCLGYFCKNLDQANISNAYVSVCRFFFYCSNLYFCRRRSELS